MDGRKPTEAARRIFGRRQARYVPAWHAGCAGSMWAYRKRLHLPGLCTWLNVLMCCAKVVSKDPVPLRPIHPCPERDPFGFPAAESSASDHPRSEAELPRESALHLPPRHPGDFCSSSQFPLCLGSTILAPPQQRISCEPKGPAKETSRDERATKKMARKLSDQAR